MSQPKAIAFVVNSAHRGAFIVQLTVDSEGRISGLFLKPVVVGATTWAAVDAQVRSAAPTVHLLVARVSGRACVPINGISPATPAPLGSAFKLYVLDALANAISSGRVGWTQKLTVTDNVKSLPSGLLQDDPSGTRVTVLQAAANMISISDNTAADMLIHLVRRNEVEAATRRAGMADPELDQPFLTTRELFTLKLDDWPHLADRYVRLDTSQKRAFLATTVDSVPRGTLLSSLRASPLWTGPRDINSIEYFASADDICRVYASLFAASHRPGLANISKVLEVSDGEIGLPRSQWTSVWFKGGSEPGVMTMNYLATTSDGRTYVVSVLCEDASAPIRQIPAELAVLNAAKGAFELAARAG
jgi:hypothetical protein